jgi:hypothetical protein
MKECVDDTRNEKERGRDVEEIFFKPCVDSKGRKVCRGGFGRCCGGRSNLRWNKHQWYAYLGKASNKKRAPVVRLLGKVCALLLKSTQVCRFPSTFF